jgi:8-oxo-dGTP pyrophosphatase MutT (NUDIX family)
MTTPEVPVRAAATVVLLREGDAPLEVFLLKRNPHSGFVPGAYLFPGGAIDDADGGADLATRSALTTERAAELLGRSDAMAFWMGAIRETFEEAGLLMADRSGRPGLGLDDPDRADRFAEHRRLVDLGQRPFDQMVRDEDLLLRTDRLLPFARWITPLGAPRRYDTRFFVATAPTDQIASHDGVEAIDSLWVSPAIALERERSGEWPMIEPTTRTLEVLTRFERADDALDAITEASRDGRPDDVREHGAIRIRLPFDAPRSEAVSP